MDHRQVVNRWTLISQWLNITKVYFFCTLLIQCRWQALPSHGTPSRSEWFWVVNKQSWRQGPSHCLSPEGTHTSSSYPFVNCSWLSTPRETGRILFVQVNSWDPVTFPEPPTCISLIRVVPTSTPGIWRKCELKRLPTHMIHNLLPYPRNKQTM